MTSPASPTLPELPDALWCEINVGARAVTLNYFTAAQLRRYGQQCYEAGVRAEREIAEKIEAIPSLQSMLESRCFPMGMGPDNGQNLTPMPTYADWLRWRNSQVAAIRKGDSVERTVTFTEIDPGPKPPGVFF